MDCPSVFISISWVTLMRELGGEGGRERGGKKESGGEGRGGGKSESL